MDLREDYKKEKGKWASVVCSDIEGNTYFTDSYVEWLEEKLVKNCSIHNVVGRSEQLCQFEDIPSELHTLKQLKDDGYDKEDVEAF